MKIEQNLLKPNILECKKTYFMSENDNPIYRIVLSQWIDLYNEKVKIIYIETNNIRKAKKDLLQYNDIFKIEKDRFIY